MAVAGAEAARTPDRAGRIEIWAARTWQFGATPWICGSKQGMGGLEAARRAVGMRSHDAGARALKGDEAIGAMEDRTRPEP